MYSFEHQSFIPRRNHGRSRRITSKLCGICDANTRRGSAQLLHKSACQFIAAILRYQRPSGAPASRFFVENGDASRGRETRWRWRSSLNLQGTSKFDDRLNVSHFYEASKAVGGRGGSRLHFQSSRRFYRQFCCATPLWPDYTGGSFCRCCPGVNPMRAYTGRCHWATTRAALPLLPTGA